MEVNITKYGIYFFLLRTCLQHLSSCCNWSKSWLSLVNFWGLSDISYLHYFHPFHHTIYVIYAWISLHIEKSKKDAKAKEYHFDFLFVWTLWIRVKKNYSNDHNVVQNVQLHGIESKYRADVRKLSVFIGCCSELSHREIPHSISLNYVLGMFDLHFSKTIQAMLFNKIWSGLKNMFRFFIRLLLCGSLK